MQHNHLVTITHKKLAGRPKLNITYARRPSMIRRRPLNLKGIRAVGMQHLNAAVGVIRNGKHSRRTNAYETTIIHKIPITRPPQKVNLKHGRMIGIGGRRRRRPAGYRQRRRTAKKQGANRIQQASEQKRPSKNMPAADRRLRGAIERARPVRAAAAV